MSAFELTNQSNRVSPRSTMLGEKIRRMAAVAAAAISLTVTVAPVSAADDNAAGPMPHARLAADWWTWVLETPASINPMLETDGRFCDVNQGGKVWFLAGTFGGDADRACTVPAGKMLFFPVVNAVYGAFLNDPPGMKSIPFLRKQVACVAGSTFWAKLDGNPIAPVHERSIPFVVHLPEGDNVLGATPNDIKNLMLAPSIDEGYYVLLQPLSTGEHTIEFQNFAGGTGNCSANLHVIYRLTVE